MNLSAPPGIASGRLGLNPAGYRENKKIQRAGNYRLFSFDASSRYSRLLVQGSSDRLPDLFICHRCGGSPLDHCDRDETRDLALPEVHNVSPGFNQSILLGRLSAPIERAKLSPPNERSVRR